MWKFPIFRVMVRLTLRTLDTLEDVVRAEQKRSAMRCAMRDEIKEAERNETREMRR